jgi:hypothetical protein
MPQYRQKQAFSLAPANPALRGIENDKWKIKQRTADAGQ